MRLKTEDARKQANKTISKAQKQARRQLIQARIAAVRVRSGAQAKASRVSAKAVAAAGVVGLVAGYFLRGRGVVETESNAQYRTGQAETANSQTSAKEPSLST